MAKHPKRPLWRCPRCQRKFANRNQSHFCGRHNLKTHFEGKTAVIRAIFDAVLAAVRRCGPVIVLPEKTRIAFQVRMSFAQVTPRLRWVDAHVVLARRMEHPRFRRIDTISTRNHAHHFRLSSLSDVNEDVEGWLAEAYAVGQQQHLKTWSRPRTPRISQALSVRLYLATRKKKAHDANVSAAQLLQEVWALPANEREQFLFALLDDEESALRPPAGRSKRVKWPDVLARARRIFGRRVFPNLVLLERSEKNWWHG
jgi:endogenous inhibitor of DNA gyrase (YacG/DUF329 family)